MGRPLKRITPDNHFDYTVGDLYKATITHLWKGQRDEHETRYRWSLMVDLLGRDAILTHIKRRHFQVAVDQLKLTKTNRGRLYKGATINRFLAAASKPFRWAVDEELLDAMLKIPWQEEEEGRILFLREHDVGRFLAYISENHCPKRALACQILLVSGMRIGELISLRDRQIEYDGSAYYLQLEASDTKTKKCRSIPFPAQLVGPLRQLIAEGVPHYRSLYRACLDASEALDLPDRVTPHVLRHTTATLMTKKGTPSLTVGKILGHSSVSTTARYNHFIPATNPLISLVNDYEYCDPETTGLRTQGPLLSDDDLTDVKRPHAKSKGYGGVGGLVRIRTGVQGFAESSAKPKTKRKPLKSRDNQ